MVTDAGDGGGFLMLKSLPATVAEAHGTNAPPFALKGGATEREVVPTVGVRTTVTVALELAGTAPIAHVTLPLAGF